MNGENGKKKTSGKGRSIALIVLAIIISFAKLSSEEFAISLVIIMLAALVLGIYAVVKAAKKQAEDRGDERSYRSAPRRESIEDRPLRRESLEDRPSHFRRGPLEDKPISRAQREMLPMDEYERRKRIEQLEGFLKNGIIDKAEYRKLRARYER